MTSKDVRLFYKGFCGTIAYSPDGKKLAMSVPDVRSGFKITLIDLVTGSDKRIGVRTFNGKELIWSNDGTRLFFVSSRKSESAIWSVGVDGKNITRLTSQGVPTMAPALSPDGQKFACQVKMLGSYSPELVVCTTSGATSIRLTNSSSPSFWSPVWSPDAKEFAFQSDVNHATELFIGSANGRRSKALTRILNADPAEVSWLPDGKKLLMADVGNLIVVNKAGGKDAVKQFSTLAGQAQGIRLIGDEGFSH